MTRIVLVWAWLLTAVSFAAAEDSVSLPGDPPQFFVVTSIDDQGLVIARRPLSSKDVDPPNIIYKPATKTLQATDARGKQLSKADLRTRLKKGSVVLISADERPVDALLLSVVKKDTVVLLDIFPRKGATGISAGN